MLKILDNFLPQEDFDKVQEALLSSTFPWYYSPTIAQHKEV